MMLPTSGTSRWRSGALGKGKCQCSGSEGESTIVSSQRSEESNTEGKVGEGRVCTRNNFYITLTRFHSQVIFLVSFINSCSNRVVIQEKKIHHGVCSIFSSSSNGNWVTAATALKV